MITNPSVLIMLADAQAAERALPRRRAPVRPAAAPRRWPRFSVRQIVKRHHLRPMRGV